MIEGIYNLARRQEQFDEDLTKRSPLIFRAVDFHGPDKLLLSGPFSFQETAPTRPFPWLAPLLTTLVGGLRRKTPARVAVVEVELPRKCGLRGAALRVHPRHGNYNEEGFNQHAPASEVYPHPRREELRASGLELESGALRRYRAERSDSSRFEV